MDLEEITRSLYEKESNKQIVREKALYNLQMKE